MEYCVSYLHTASLSLMTQMRSESSYIQIVLIWNINPHPAYNNWSSSWCYSVPRTSITTWLLPSKRFNTFHSWVTLATKAMHSDKMAVATEYYNSKSCHTVQIYVQSQLRLLSFYFSLFTTTNICRNLCTQQMSVLVLLCTSYTTCFGPYWWPSSGGL
jgi:hypothetical protein